MASIKVILTKAQFSDMLADFAAAVKDKKAEKLSYDLWRPLYLWSKPDSSYEKFSIRYEDSEKEYIIGPYDNRKVTPNPVVINRSTDCDFWEHVEQEYNYRCNETMSMSQAFEKIQVSCSNYSDSVNSISNSLNSLNNTLTSINNDEDVYYDWNNCTIGTGTNGYYPTNIELTPETLIIEGKPFEEYLKNFVDEHKKEKENKTMNFNFDFGPVDTSVRMSLYGMAIKNATGNYVAYDPKSKQIVDVDILNFEGANKFMYKMPVALKEVRSGDVVVHCRKPMFVNMVQSDGRLKVLDIYTGEEKTIVPTTSPFGFNFITKVVSLVDMTGVANAENPFGNLLPFLLMSDGKNDDMLPFLLMSQNGAMMQNPMLMYMMLGKDNKMNDMLPWLLMCGSPFNPAGMTKANAECTCGGNCHCHDTSAENPNK